MTTMETITRRQKKDIRLLGRFTEVWCEGHDHQNREPFMLPNEAGTLMLCHSCLEFMDYAVKKRLRCPIEAEKPSCKHCRIHCYANPQRQLVRQIMAYAGKKLILQGRIDYLWHFFF
jgi:hypothetical protein